MLTENGSIKAVEGRLFHELGTDFVEARGHVFVGDSRRRMTLENVPSHDAVRWFPGRLADVGLRGAGRAARQPGRAPRSS